MGQDPKHSKKFFEYVSLSHLFHDHDMTKKIKLFGSLRNFSFETKIKKIWTCKLLREVKKGGMFFLKFFFKIFSSPSNRIKRCFQGEFKSKNSRASAEE